jgi:REP element-mobilizing transposase RayT
MDMLAAPSETISFWWGHLPHWEIIGGRYLITIHLAGAIPPSGQERIKSQVERLRTAVASGQSGHWQRLRLFAAMERWLDRAPQVRHLGAASVADAVCQAIEHRVAQGHWELFEYVVLPSHIHLFMRLSRARLKDSMEQFKTWTGGQAIRLLQGETVSPFWQKEWFDHWSRSLPEDDSIASYIRANPVKAGLVQDWRDWPWSSWYRRGSRSGNGTPDLQRFAWRREAPGGRVMAPPTYAMDGQQGPIP